MRDGGESVAIPRKSQKETTSQKKRGGHKTVSPGQTARITFRVPPKKKLFLETEYIVAMEYTKLSGLFQDFVKLTDELTPEEMKNVLRYGCRTRPQGVAPFSPLSVVPPSDEK